MSTKTRKELATVLTSFAKNHYKPDLHSGMFYGEGTAVFVNFERGRGFSITGDTACERGLTSDQAVEILTGYKINEIEI